MPADAHDALEHWIEDAEHNASGTAHGDYDEQV
jgi:hypothetical protein